jgi:hypothetical protein
MRGLALYPGSFSVLLDPDRPAPGLMLSSSFRFEPDGRIIGYAHPNETAYLRQSG